MNAKEMMKKVMMIAAVVGASALTVLAAETETLCSGESAEVKLDLATGTVRTPAATETLTYSTEWDGGSAVALAVNGTTLASGLTGDGTYDWTPTGSGLFTLTHTTATSSGDVVLTATFMAPPKYVAPVYVGDVAAKGIDHWVTNTVPSGYTFVESAAAHVMWGTAGATSWYVVDGDVQIDGGVQCKGNVNLVLCDGAKLTVTNVANYNAGIQTDASGSFTIYGTPDGAGELDVTSGYGGAGIGGSNEDDKSAGSHITINGGVVTATGAASGNDSGGAGIGGAYYGVGSDIVINGGVVRAKSILSGAGIGGGYHNSGSDIVVNGGAVSAEGVSCGAGIGGGSKAEGRNIVINGGVLVAKSSEGAGIGGGYWAAGTGIVINGGDVTAESVQSGAGIGGGVGGRGSDIAINGGEVSVCAETTVFGENADVSDLIGSGNYGAAAENVTIADSANVCFNLTGVWDWENEEWIEEPAASPKSFEGFVIMTPETQTVSRVLVGGADSAQGLSALPAFAITNEVTGATNTIAIGGAPQRFASANLKLKHANSQLTLNVFDATQVGEDAWADIEDGDCTIFGTGATWAKSDWKSGNPLKTYDAAITNLIVADGVTGLGANSFENLWYLQNVTLAESVTDIGARAFKKCYGLTNVTSAATGASSVGEYAFSGCHSLQGLSFAGTVSFEEQAYTLQAAIYMKEGGIPVVYAMPTITVAGKSEHIMGKKTMNDSWTDVTNFTDEQKKDYHFFKIEMK